MNRALVTGATGMLGFYVGARLAEEGWTVRGLARHTVAADQLAAQGIEPALGDLHDAPSLERAARGCDAVFHAAAEVGSGSDERAFQAANVAGTAYVVEAAARAGARLVHVSSTAVFGPDRYHARPTDEEHRLPELAPADAYGRSKQDAERTVLAAQRAGRVWAAVVRPPVMYGRRDRQFAPRVGPMLQRRCFPLIGGGRTTLTLVHADAVADGAVRAALHDGANGRIYHLTNDFEVTVADLVRFAAEGLGRPIWAPALPVPLGRLGFRALERTLAWAGRADLARHADGTLQMLTRDNPFISARARCELGWAPRIPPSAGLPDAFRWWREHRRRP
jgi:nucleoside-diphosphate-sugar epimerase